MASGFCIPTNLWYPLRAVLLVGMLCSGLRYASAQVPATRQQADRYFHSQQYARAVHEYRQLLEAPSLGTLARREILFNLGTAYKELGDTPKAEAVYRQFLEWGEPGEQYPLAYLYFAQVLGYNGKLEEAQRVYARFQQAGSGPVKSTSSPAGTRAATAGRQSYRLENLSLNTAASEFSPAYFLDGLVYVAGKNAGSTTSPGKGLLNLYYLPNRNDLQAVSLVGPDGKETPLRRYTPATATRLGRDSYTRATANDSPTVGTFGSLDFSEGLGFQQQGTQPGIFSKDLTTRYHEGPVTFSADGSQLIFTRTNTTDQRTLRSSDRVSRLKLYSAELRDGGWTNVQELPFNSDEYSTGHPTLSRDGKLLYFASDRPGGWGGTDLYVARREGTGWSAPINLGPGINTAKEEMFPFVDENGNLYFASSGRKPGLGGLDLYFVPLLNGRARGEVEHLEAPLNSPADDFGLITDGNRSKGYLSSNRLRGNDDIFRFVSTGSLVACRNLTVRVLDESTSAPLDSVLVTFKARGEGRDRQELYTNASGEVSICLDPQNDFLIELSRGGYLSGTLGFSTTGLKDDRPSRLGFSLRRLEPPPATDDLPAMEPPPGTPASEPLAVSTLRGTVNGQFNRKPIEGVKITLVNKCDNSIKQTVTGPDGRFEFELTEGCDYDLTASKPLYGTNTNAIRKLPKKAEPKLVSAELKMLKVGDVVMLDNIYYDSGKWDIRPDAARELDKMANTLSKYPTLRFEIGSHTDSQGNAAFNQYLSERRAQSVLSYLASRGIARSRMTARGYGESTLLNQCRDGVLCTEKEHQRNRRTEFKVLEIR
jgi:outer membrane protein OmpA-like peptidoglycan-associated protein